MYQPTSGPFEVLADKYALSLHRNSTTRQNCFSVGSKNPAEFDINPRIDCNQTNLNNSTLTYSIQPRYIPNQPEDELVKLMKQMKSFLCDQLCLGVANPISLLH
ncbi:hypothetical protein EDC94DRAFT_584607 [Helicostylum pulchrum]|nr:hypothetical protein EDC94DRAFT_584607 [Helicostylum pulchrum]